VARTAAPSELRVEELAARAGLAVDTVRYYQAQGLLAAPRRRGRTAIYDHEHLQRLDEIRTLADRGFTLAQIAALDAADTDPLLRLLAGQRAVEPGLDGAELARRTGLDPGLVQRIADLGLIGGAAIDGRTCFPSAAVEVLSVMARLIAAGVPVDRLGELALRHARQVEELTDEVIELYRRHRTSADREALAAEVDQLVPLVGAMVGAHFQATLVDRAARRLGSGRDRSS